MKTSTFRKYDHVERLGHPDTDGITIGKVYVFPKLDGTNASIWWDDGIRCASRRRVVTPDDDNAGFAAWALGNDAERLQQIVAAHPGWILYGEWLVPHTLKTYREEAWRRFWVFDVFDRDRGGYVAFDEYAPQLEGVDVIEPLCTITNPSEEQIRAQAETNTYLIADGAGLGEGIVVKNYLWSNAFGRQPWAKVVRNEFKERNRRAFGVTEKTGEFQVEAAIAEECVTAHLVGKTRAKVVLDIANEQSVDLSEPNAQAHVEARNRGRVIPQLLGRVFHDLVIEELWGAIKKHKDPVIDFKRLRQHTVLRVKSLAQDLFA